MVTEACFKCGKQGHFLRDCPYRSETGTAVSEPTVQHLRQGGAGTPPGRKQGQTAGTAQTRGRPVTQGSQQLAQPRAFALIRQEAAETSDCERAKNFSLLDKEYK